MKHSNKNWNGFKVCDNCDLEQTDIIKENGLEDSIKRFIGLDGVGFSRFTLEDVTRHPIDKVYSQDTNQLGYYLTHLREITLSRY